MEREGGHFFNSVIQNLFRLARHPRALLDSVLTYPRFLGTIKPRLMTQDSAQIAGVQSIILASYWPVRMECPTGARILAVSPHADDETIGAGGLPITHKDVSQIAVITIFNGEGGGRLTSADGGGKDYKERGLLRSGRQFLQVVGTREMNLSCCRLFRQCTDCSCCSPPPKTRTVCAFFEFCRSWPPVTQTDRVANKAMIS
jgi:hypothetical protein